MSLVLLLGSFRLDRLLSLHRCRIVLFFPRDRFLDLFALLNESGDSDAYERRLDRRRT